MQADEQSRKYADARGCQAVLYLHRKIKALFTDRVRPLQKDRTRS
jgi:hypothetical protein